MDVRIAAHALGGSVSGRDRVLCPGPGHRPHDRSLSVRFDSTAPDGFIVESFAGDPWDVCKDHVRRTLGLGSFEPGQGCRENTKWVSYLPAPQSVESVQKAEFALSLWKEAKPIGGTLAECYLADRGIEIPGSIYAGRSVRYHPACPFRLDSGETVRLPAQIAAMVNIATNEFQGIHRTALDASGNGKARMRGLDDAKKMLGSSKGACIKLSPDEAVSTGLAIAEGIETALAVMGNFGIAPVWATMSAGTMARFPVLGGIECLSIFADNDHAKLQGGRLRQAGNEAARQCAANWTEEGRECVIWTPPDVGSDFNSISARAAA